MKEKIILNIAALDVPMSELKKDIEVAKKRYFYRDFCFTWATMIGLLNEIVDKDKTILIAGLNVPIKEIVEDVEAARKKYHYTEFCFTWATVEALCDVVESQYDFQGLYFFYNEDGTKQVQKKKNIEDSDWFAIEHCDNVYLIFKKINGVVKKVKELMRNDIRYFENDNNRFNF